MRRLLPLLLAFPLLSWGQNPLTIRSIPTFSSTTVDTSKQQPTIRKNYLRKDVWRLDFLGPGYLNEHRLGRLITVVSQLRLVGTFRNEDRFESNGLPFSYTRKNVIAFSINPELSIAIRQFYNLAKRREAGKTTRYNSGSYFAIKGNYIAPPIFKNTYTDIRGLGFSTLWGVQHTATKHFYVNVELGVGVAQYYKNTISPTGNLILGYTF